MANRDYSEYLGELYADGSVKKLPKRTMRDTALPEDPNGISTVQVSSTQFVVYPPGRISAEDPLLAEVRAFVTAPAEKKPKEAPST